MYAAHCEKKMWKKITNTGSSTFLFSIKYLWINVLFLAQKYTCCISTILLKYILLATCINWKEEYICLINIGCCWQYNAHASGKSIIRSYNYITEIIPILAFLLTFRLHFVNTSVSQTKPLVGRSWICIDNLFCLHTSFQLCSLCSISQECYQ